MTIEWVREPVALGDACTEDPALKNKCSLLVWGAFGFGNAAASGQWLVDKCIAYYCANGAMPTPEQLPSPPPLVTLYPWGVYAPETVTLQKTLNAKLKADGLCPVNEDGKLGAGTCGAAKHYGASAGLPCKSFTAPAPCGGGGGGPSTPAAETASPALAPASDKTVWWVLGGLAALTAVAVFVLPKGGVGAVMPAASENPGSPEYQRGYEEGKRDAKRGIDPQHGKAERTHYAVGYVHGYRDGMREAPRLANANPSGYYVKVLGGNKETYGPYPTLKRAKTFARIGATKGAHDRVVLQGGKVKRHYRARTGESLVHENPESFAETGVLEHEGKTYEAGGSAYDKERGILVGYTARTTDGWALRSWNGKLIVPITLRSTFRGGFGRTKMYAWSAHYDGRHFTGRNSGEGMVVFLRAR